MGGTLRTITLLRQNASEIASNRVVTGTGRVLLDRVRVVSNSLQTRLIKQRKTEDEAFDSHTRLQFHPLQFQRVAGDFILVLNCDGGQWIPHVDTT